MEIVTRTKAIENLTKYIGQDLRELAEKYEITVYKDGRQNKGWKGLVLERLAGLNNSNDSAPNGLGFELKSVSFIKDVDGSLTPKETMAITMINPDNLKTKGFFESHCWEKLKSLVFCAVEWTERNSENAKLLDVTSFDLAETDYLIQEIKEDYEFIQRKLIDYGFENLTGKYGEWIQPRTKGAGHGSISRAFYARKRLVSKIFDRV